MNLSISRTIILFQKWALLVLLLILSPFQAHAQSLTDSEHPFPFSTDEVHLTVWNGEDYSPLFIKGVNLGIAVPGTFPGELKATASDYSRWFRMIREAGFNTIRLYTLHYPHFYEELKRFNEANPNYPLYFFQGVWLEEELPGYDENLFTLTESFDEEIRSNVQAVHGDITVSQRPGKAFGSYTVDTSPWMIGYIIGREIHPTEIITTNETHPSFTSHNGTYLSIENASPSESWLVERMDHLLSIEMDRYGTQRPVSVSSWPTLDPIEHPFEEHSSEEMASIDLSKVDFQNAKAGFFISYHAYPYYPNYISRDPRYTPFHDHIGQNSYLGYLTYLKQHYEGIPLIIAEFGGTSSWGVAKYAHNGIHHGGYSEVEQGKNNIRLLKNIHQSGAGGGIQFSWMDEWFKRTWIVDPFDFNPESRILWHNVTGAEQNYGLIGFRSADKMPVEWERFADDDPILALHAGADFAYLNLRLDIPSHISENDSLWIGIDTYDPDLGESVMPNGATVQNRVEFALLITNYEAELYVTEAYDTFGIWHGTSAPEQLYRSVAADGSTWRLVRWKNDNRDFDAQDIGRLQVNRQNTPTHSTDGVRLYNDHIEIRLPWTLIHFTDPSRMEVLHDDRSTPTTETRISDGISLSLFYKDFSATTTTRFIWDTWNDTQNAEEYRKGTYYVMQEYLPTLPGNPIAKSDFYHLGTGSVNIIAAEDGVLQNDLSLDGTPMEAVLVSPPKNGLLQLHADGSFNYLASDGFTGSDSFTYRVRAGFNWSEPVTTGLQVEGTPIGSGFVSLYPNPAKTNFTITSSSVIDRIEIFNMMGQRISTYQVNSTSYDISLPGVASGVYYARIFSGSDNQLKKFMIVK
ncbi:MAG: T9SS C-terminal target domain-containing protein [Balneolaceae bacterium]|nr:MAG: T9SS C-terminal target domain-containing protein [Balneolaceae bacterium]